MIGAPGEGALRTWGLALAVASVVLPALPLGAIFAQPPIPLAVLWAAYGWAAEDEDAPRGENWLQRFAAYRAPLALTLLGLVHDQLAYNPYGLFVVLYLSAYLMGRIAAVIMSAPNLVSLWGGFAVTAFSTVLIAWFVGWLITPIAIMPYAQAVLITVLLFPLARPLYMSAGASTRTRQGARR